MDLRIESVADILGPGTIQDSANGGKDQPFWNALNTHVKNLRAVVSGHGMYLPQLKFPFLISLVFCRFSKIMGMSGVPVNQPRMSSSVSTNILGKILLHSYHIYCPC